jgi:hypothetical protein
VKHCRSTVAVIFSCLGYNNNEHRTHDSTDHKDDRNAQRLKQQILDLQSDIETAHSPRNLEDRIKQIQSILEVARHNTDEFMSISDADRYWRIFEDMRLGLRDLPNY